MEGPQRDRQMKFTPSKVMHTIAGLQWDNTNVSRKTLRPDVSIPHLQTSLYTALVPAWASWFSLSTIPVASLFDLCKLCEELLVHLRFPCWRRGSTRPRPGPCSQGRPREGQRHFDQPRVDDSNFWKGFKSSSRPEGRTDRSCQSESTIPIAEARRLRVSNGCYLITGAGPAGFGVPPIGESAVS